MPEFKFLKNACGYHLSSPIATPYYNYKFILEEKVDGCEYLVTLSGVPSDSILLRLDEKNLMLVEYLTVVFLIHMMVFVKKLIIF